MINLEQLKLFLNVSRPTTGSIAGMELSDQILNHLTQLRRFTFNIKTSFTVSTSNTLLSSNERVQRSFTGKHYQRVVARVYYDTNRNNDVCHIYSLPYDFEYFYNLDNCFPGGSFHKVRLVTMSDPSPFEVALFRTISHSMPHLERLTISNEHSPKCKQRLSTPLVFPHLTYLCLGEAHFDYAKLFLLKKQKTSLPRLANVVVRDTSLEKLTKRFNGQSDHLNIDGVLFSEPSEMLL